METAPLDGTARRSHRVSHPIATLRGTHSAYQAQHEPKRLEETLFKAARS
jgi:hypothetical protein